MSERSVFSEWLPLALSRIFIQLEFCILAAAVARLPEPEIGLQVVSSHLMPLSMLQESPIWCFLSVTATLGYTRESVRRIVSLLLRVCGLILVVWLIFWFSPLRYWILCKFFGVPQYLIDYGRYAFPICFCWPVIVGVRRALHGVLVRHGHGWVLGKTSIVRVVSILAAFLTIPMCTTMLRSPEVVTVALSVGVLIELLISIWYYRRLVKFDDAKSDVTINEALGVYVANLPAGVIWAITGPIGSAVLLRMLDAGNSLMAWPALNSTLSLICIPSAALIELGSASSGGTTRLAQVRCFAYKLGVGLTLIALVCVGAEYHSGLISSYMKIPPTAAKYFAAALLCGILWPASETLLHLLMGEANARRKSRVIFEGSMLLVLVYATFAALGILSMAPLLPGLYWCAITMSLAWFIESAWILWRLES